MKLADQAVVHALPKARLEWSPVSFYYRLTHGDDCLHLGALVEVLLPDLHGVGLIAHEALTDAQLELVGALAARSIAKPFDVLKAAMVPVWDTADAGEVLSVMRRANHGSLVIGVPQSEAIPASLVIQASKMGNDESLQAVVQSEARTFMHQFLEQKMLALDADKTRGALQGYFDAEPQLMAA